MVVSLGCLFPKRGALARPHGASADRACRRALQLVAPLATVRPLSREARERNIDSNNNNIININNNININNININNININKDIEKLRVPDPS